MTSTSTRPDFGDWLSPMLVKELRQGIRSKVFMAAFYLTQVLMILSVVFNLTAVGEGDAAGQMVNFLNGLFWFMIGVPLLFLMPIRGFGSLYGEIKAGTLELVFLTRLSALRIAAGKWTALMVQTLLLVAAVLPYVLLRYFLGSVNVVQDLQSLLVLLLASGMLTAATIAISPYESKILRALFSVGMVFGFIFLLFGLIGVIAGGVIRGSAGGSFAPWTFYLGMVLFAPAFIFLGLEIAASHIAPPAENHAIRKRLLGIYLLLAAAALTFLGADAEVAYGVALVLLTVVVIDALAEPQRFVRSVYLPFLQRGPAGRFLALFFTPGWVSATWFLVLLPVLAGGLLWMHEQLDEPENILQAVSLLGWLIFPAALIRLAAPATKYFLGLYIALQFLFAAVTFLVNIMASISQEPMTTWLCPLPPCAFLLSLTEQVKDTQMTEFLAVTGLVTAASLGILLARTITPLRDIRASLRQNPPKDA